MWIYSKFFGLLIIFLLIGCTSQNQTNSSLNNSSSQTNAIKTLHLNETVVLNNISLRVIAWGYNPTWKTYIPKTGSKYLWIYTSEQNENNVPAILPSDKQFSISYRSISIDASALGYSEATFNPNQGRTGYLLFEVPDTLNNEASLNVQLNGYRYKLDLIEPTICPSAHLLIQNAIPDCYHTSDGKYSCKGFVLTTKNDMHCPFNPLSLSFKTLSISNSAPTDVIEIMWSLYQFSKYQDASTLKMYAPQFADSYQNVWGYATVTKSLIWDKDSQKWVFDGNPIGSAGANVPFDLVDSNNEIHHLTVVLPN